MAGNTKAHNDQVNGLSAIEAEIMHIIWNDKTTVREVHEELLKSGYVPYTTIMAAMNNMANKGLLKQSKKYRAYSYSATLTNLEVATQIIDNVVDKILDGKPDPILRHLLRIKSETELASIYELRERLYSEN